jgi:glutathione S-transferase
VEPQLRTRLENPQFVSGDEFSAADCIIGCNVFWATKYHLCTDDVFTQYMSRLSERPAFARAFSDVSGSVLTVPEDSPAVALFTG